MDSSCLEDKKSTLQQYYENNNGRLPTKEIPEDIKKVKYEDNKALKVFYENLA